MNMKLKSEFKAFLPAFPWRTQSINTTMKSISTIDSESLVW